jgi:hypothetical protein
MSPKSSARVHTASFGRSLDAPALSSSLAPPTDLVVPLQCRHQRPDRRGCRGEEGYQRLQQENSGQARLERDQATPALPWPSQCTSLRPSSLVPRAACPANTRQITCLYDMDIPRPDNFNETYLYEGTQP